MTMIDNAELKQSNVIKLCEKQVIGVARSTSGSSSLLYSGRPKVETFCSAHKLENVSTLGRPLYTYIVLLN